MNVICRTDLSLNDGQLVKVGGISVNEHDAIGSDGRDTYTVIAAD
jgi:hypothetical protein